MSRKSYKINFKRFWEIKRLLKEFDNNANNVSIYWPSKTSFPLTKTDIYQIKKCKTYQEYRELVRGGGVVKKELKMIKSVLKDGFKNSIESETVAKYFDTHYPCKKCGGYVQDGTIVCNHCKVHNP